MPKSIYVATSINGIYESGSHESIVTTEPKKNGNPVDFALQARAAFSCGSLYFLYRVHNEIGEAYRCRRATLSPAAGSTSQARWVPSVAVGSAQRMQ